MSTCVKTPTYADVIMEHQQLDIDFDQTIAVINLLFPEQINEAVALWNVFEGRKLGVIQDEAIISLENCNETT